MSNSSSNEQHNGKIALVFIWSQFKNLESRVSAGMSDIRRMNEFWKPLGFETEVFHNRPKSVFKDKIRQVKQDYDSKRYSCLAIVISTHGEECVTKIQTEPFCSEREIIQHRLFVNNDDDAAQSDDFVVLYDDLLLQFDNPNVDTPKIFLIQSCRKRKQEPQENSPSSSGTQTSQHSNANLGLDTGIKIQLVDEIEEETVPVLQETDVNNSHQQPSESEGDQIPYSPPCSKNSIVVFSAPSGYVSTGGYKGSVLLTAVHEHFQRVSGEFSFVKFMTKVNHNLSKTGRDLEVQVYKPVASIAHRLTEDIRLQKQN